MKSFGLTAACAGFLCAAGLAPAASRCSGTVAQLDRLVDNVKIDEASSVAGLVMFGSRYGICFGVEDPDLDLLTRPSKANSAHARVSSIVDSLLPQGKKYRVTEQDGVILIRSAQNIPPSPLDDKLPEFRARDLSLTMTSAALANWHWADKHPGRGIAGSILGDDETNHVAPIDQRDRTVRELLSLIVSRSDSGGTWVSDSCSLAAFDGGHASCWQVIPYRYLLINELSARIAGVVDRQRRERQIRK